MDLGVAGTLRTEIISGHLTSMDSKVNKWLYANADLEVISMSNPIVDQTHSVTTAVVFIVFRNEKIS